jgi:hypothetical protein
VRIGNIDKSTQATTAFLMLADEFGQMYGERPTASPKAPDIEHDKPLDRAKINPDPEREPVAYEAALENLYRDFHAEPAYPRTALCLSGGGIRSAAFALGLIQFLAKKELLHRFEYLSTVSGGGYIGSWLSAWFTRVADVRGKGGYAKIGPQLACREMPEREPLEIDALRANSNYLTPKLGALSADTWTALAIWLRNLLINWFLLIPLIAAAAVIPQLMSALAGTLEGGKLAQSVQLFGIGCYFLSLAFFNCARPRWQASKLDQGSFLIFSWIPLLVAALMWAVSMAHPSDLTAFMPAQIGPFRKPIPDYVLLAVVLYLFAMLITVIFDSRWSDPYVRPLPPLKAGDVLKYSFRRSRAAPEKASVEVYVEDHQAAAGRHYVTQSHKTNIEFEPNTSEGKGTLEIKLEDQKIGDAQVTDGDFFIKFRNPHHLRIGAIPVRYRLWDIAMFIFSGACFGLFLGAGDLLFRGWFDPAHNGQMTVAHHLVLSTLAVPWLLLSHALATVVFVALTSWLPRSDEEREWIGRAAGWVLITAILWLLIAALVLLLPYAVAAILNDFHITSQMVSAKNLPATIAAIASGIGAVSGVLTAIVGGGPKTAAIPGQPQTFWRKFALYVGAPVFLASLFVGLALAVDWLAFGDVFERAIAQKPQHPETGAPKIPEELWTTTPDEFCRIVCRLTAWGILPAAVSIIIGFAININRFSLHEMYRNRLVRAFLGASNIERDEQGRKKESSQRDLFTFLNFTDNLPVSRLWFRQKEKELNSAGDRTSVKPCKPKDDWRPFHVLNIALNLVDTEKPAWQERKAESFTVSPLWCGSAQLEAYRRTSEYGGNEPITLGTAMAISGAAVSPNMGYNSSPLITFLLTLFNVRLGWWLGNPKGKSFANDGPWLAAAPLLIELFGLTNDKRRYVYLSDGGHFENLGLYEMVRRRCHFIIVSDAGQDPELSFADLANAVRKISIDLGVRIEFPKLEELRVRNKDRNKPKEGGPCYTVGRIRYSEADNVSDDKDGYILYLKPGFRGDEPADIVGYAAESTDFPHETTADQWFSESQFESYRKLGFSIMERAHNAAVENYNSGKSKDKKIKDFRASTALEFFESLSMIEKVDANSTYIGAAGPPSG